MSFSFGTPSSAPATGSLTGGFSFGANKPATPGFGLTSAAQPSTGLFGTPASTAPAFGTSGGFGAAATPNFGSTPAFGATSSAPAFGATSAAPAFGATATPSFGAAPTFGATSAAPAFGATSTAPAFGATTTLGFGAASATPAFGSTTTPSFGAAATPAFGASGLGAGGVNFSSGSNTGAPATGLTLGAPTASAASTGLGGLGGFGFGGTTTSTVGAGLGGFFATSTANTSTGLFGPKLGTTTVTGTLPSTSVLPSLGLGGIAPTGTAANTTDGKPEPPKQTKLPNEILSTVESFKEFVKKQKSLSSEVMRVSIKPLNKVSREAEATLRAAASLSGAVGRARARSRRLRAAAAAAEAAAESVASAPMSELEGAAPPSYVKELISELEQQLITFRRQMEVADKQMQSTPKLLSEQELTLGIRRMHESLVALAGRLQAAHAQVEAQKEQYMNLRKYILKDNTNVFEAPTTSTSLDQILRDAEGSRKRPSAAVLADPRAALGNIQQLAGPTPFSYVGNSLSPFVASDASGPTWQPQPQTGLNQSLNVSFGSQPATESAFQLQKPPGKRGKQ